jgi:hypothetical protein
MGTKLIGTAWFCAVKKEPKSGQQYAVFLAIRLVNMSARLVICPSFPRTVKRIYTAREFPRISWLLQTLTRGQSWPPSIKETANFLQSKFLVMPAISYVAAVGSKSGVGSKSTLVVVLSRHAKSSSTF